MTEFEMWAVEYSVRQNCFHVSKLKNVLKTNMRTAVNQVDNDYRILYITESWEKAMLKSKELRLLIDEGGVNERNYIKD